MSRDASVTLTWADEDHHFRLAFAQLILLQEATDCGPFALLQRLSDGTWKVQDISHVIRIGLIGGGLKPDAAIKLVRGYVEDRPPLENLLVAQAILSAGVMGAPEEEGSKKKPRVTGQSSTLSPTESGDLPKSSPLVQ